MQNTPQIVKKFCLLTAHMSLQRIAVPRLISSVHTPSRLLKVHLMFSHSLHSKFPSFLFIPQISSQTACMHICPSVPHAPPIFLIWSFDCSSRTYYSKHNLRALSRFIILRAIRIQDEKCQNDTSQRARRNSEAIVQDRALYMAILKH